MLKTRRVVIAVPHDDPDLVQDNGPHQLVCALDLNHNGGDVVGRLKEEVWWGTGRKLLFVNARHAVVSQ